MSPKRDKSVLQLVEKYKEKYPSLERDLLRKLIRLENPEHFKTSFNKDNSSNLKKLDRYLRKSFNQPGQDHESGQISEVEKDKAELRNMILMQIRLLDMEACNSTFRYDPVYQSQIRERRDALTRNFKAAL